MNNLTTERKNIMKNTLLERSKKLVLESLLDEENTKMKELTATVTGRNITDLTEGLNEIKKAVENGNSSGQNEGEDRDYNFQVKELIEEQDESIEEETLTEDRAKGKAPKKWFDSMVKEVKKNNPSYTDEQADATVGSIWFNKLSPEKKAEINKKYRG